MNRVLQASKAFRKRMVSREGKSDFAKVMRGLRCCSTEGYVCPVECPYSVMKREPGHSCMGYLTADAYVLMQQMAKKVDEQLGKEVKNGDNDH